MKDSTSIEWTHREGTKGETWNPTKGCDLISPGCAHCYAKTFAERWRGVVGHTYEHGFDPREAPEHLLKPLSWRNPRTVFVNSMSDLGHEAFSDDFIAQVFAVMSLTPQHTYQTLTKRPMRFHALLSSEAFVALVENRAKRIAREQGMPIPPGRMLLWPLANVWVGVTTENQKCADERIPRLLETPAAVRFLSVEPLLGPVDLRRHIGPFDDGRGFIDWVIVGGESGPGARPCDVAWIRSVVAQCKAAGVPCFVKQLGAAPVNDLPATKQIVHVAGKMLGFEHAGGVINLKGTLRDRKGGDPDEWPADLRVREFPR